MCRRESPVPRNGTSPELQCLSGRPHEFKTWHATDTARAERPKEHQRSRLCDNEIFFQIRRAKPWGSRGRPISMLHISVWKDILTGSRNSLICLPTPTILLVWHAACHSIFGRVSLRRRALDSEMAVECVRMLCEAASGNWFRPVLFTKPRLHSMLVRGVTEQDSIEIADQFRKARWERGRKTVRR